MLAGALAAMFGRILPLVPAALVRPLSEIGGTIAYAVSPRARAAVRANLAVIRPEGGASVRRTFVYQVRNYLETFRLLRERPERIRKMVDIRGWEHFAAAHAQGRGVIIGSAHLGPVIICGQILSAMGYPVTIPVEIERSVVDAAVNRARSAMGVTFVPTDSAIGIHRVLRRGGVLGTMTDRAVTGVGERVSFFGREALLPSAHVALALRSGAPLLPAFAHHRDGRLVAHVEAPLPLSPGTDRDAAVREGVRAFAAVLERHIREAPEEWAVFDRVWDEAA